MGDIMNIVSNPSGGDTGGGNKDKLWMNGIGMFSGVGRELMSDNGIFGWDPLEKKKKKAGMRGRSGSFAPTSLLGLFEDEL